MDDIVAQFMAVTSSEAPTAQQYLEASDWNLEQAVELYFASGGASVESQQPAPNGGGDDNVRDRIEGFDDQLVDEEAQIYNEVMRNTRRAEARARKPPGIFNQDRDIDFRDQPMSRHERRLANLFRPPFDIISDLSLEEAREAAQEKKKLVMVNVQDLGEFACQQLNRDLFRSAHVKDIVAKNFVFLQLDAEDPDGEEYRVLYPFENYPHISILDPWTGEQQKIWSKVPGVSEFVEDVVDFLATTEQPIVADGDAAAEPESVDKPAAGEPAASEPAASRAPAEPVDKVAQIEPRDYPEPPRSPETTNIQLRYGDGKRTVRRFALNEPVDNIFAIAKHVLGVTGIITLTSERRELKSELGKTIEEANLKNSSVLVEVEQ